MAQELNITKISCKHRWDTRYLSGEEIGQSPKTFGQKVLETYIVKVLWTYILEVL